MTTPTTFPIMGCPRSKGCGCNYQTFQIPWAALAPHEQQAQKNHSQSLARLAERGGLSWGEAHAVLTGRPWSSVDVRRCFRPEVEALVHPSEGTAEP